MSYPFWMISFALIVMETLLQKAVAASPGEVRPNRKEMEIGSSVNISCSMNLSTPKLESKNSSTLYFVEDKTGMRVPQSEITIVNSTTIVWTLQDAVEQNKLYICKSDVWAIGMVEILVGTKPQNITDFKCFNYDREYMVCDFTRPKNTIPTNYKLKFYVGNEDYFYNCTPSKVEQSHFYYNITNLSQFISQKIFDFELTSNNSLGLIVQHSIVNQEKCNIPAKQNFTLHNVTADGVTLLWNNTKYTPKEVEFDVTVRAHNVDMAKQPVKTVSIEKREIKLAIKELPYPFYKYTLTVRTKRKVAPNEPIMWSEPFIAEFQTKPTAPDEPPVTDIGSFYVISDTMRIYWRQLPHYQHNGANFKYAIVDTKVNGVQSNLMPTSMDNTSATFEWNPNWRYEFKIKSKNDNGFSKGSSRIIVPAMPNLEESTAPKWIRNEFDAFNMTYTLSWNSPHMSSELVDYTVFWCPALKASPNECLDTIEFQHVARNNTKFQLLTTQNDHPLNFAVSANYRDFSSGMHWTMCTAYESSPLEKLVPDITAGSHKIDLEWELKVCDSIVEGYKLIYCRIENSSSSACLTTEKFVPIENSVRNYTLKNLEAFATYKLQMQMFSKLKVGSLSDAQNVTTAEEAPSPPRDLTLINKTTNSVWLSWEPPKDFNGIIRSYTIFANGQKRKLNCTTEPNLCGSTMRQRIFYYLNELESYTFYHIFVKAHTTKESFASNELTVLTFIGVPSLPKDINTTERANGSILVHWAKPAQPAGRVEFYEVVVKLYKGNLTEMYISQVVGATSCVINVLDCLEKNYNYILKVRAVNVANRQTEIESEMMLANLTSNNDEMLWHNSNNENLKCISTSPLSEMQQRSIMKLDDKSSVHLRSKSISGFYYGCKETAQMTWKAYSLIAVAFIGVLASICGAPYFYIKRKAKNDIEVIFPTELDNNSQADCVKQQNEDSKDSYEALLKQNMNTEHVLDARTPSSGYESSDSTTESQKWIYKPMKVINGGEHMQTTLETAEMPIPTMCGNTVSGCELNLSDYQQNYPADMSDIIAAKDGYFSHNLWQNNNKNKMELPLTTNGYVMPQSPQMKWEPPEDLSGYVKQSDLTAFGQQSVG